MGKNKMEKKIVIVDANPDSGNELSDIIHSKNYPLDHTHELSSLEDYLSSDQYVAVVMDIDSIQVDNRTIRNLALKYPSVRFLCTSRDRFHPELKDAICYHIYACLNKPVDPDELLFWLKCIYEEEAMPDA